MAGSTSSTSFLPATPQVSTGPPGAATVTIIPTQVVVGDATLTRNAPGTIIDDTSVSLGSDALVIGTSTIPFATSGTAPIYTVAGQTIAAGPAGVAIAGTTISNNGPAVTLSGTPVSLGSFGLVINDASTFAIPTVQPLQSVFAVGNHSLTEQYGRIIFPSTQAVANSSVAATGTAAGSMPMSSALPFMGAAARTKSGFGIAVVVFCASAFVMMYR
ncbi:hypothetical protein BDR22DRAFT_895214 [Usnea florida]